MNATKTGRPHLKKRKTDEKKNKGLFAEAHTVAPAPSRDYYALQLYQKKFLWTRWKISHGPFANPLQRVVSMDEFLRDNSMQNELTYIFETAFHFIRLEVEEAGSQALEMCEFRSSIYFSSQSLVLLTQQSSTLRGPLRIALWYPIDCHKRGADITHLISDLAREKWTLISMPSDILQKIFSYINVSDILRLSQVCKRLSKECSKNELWKTICKKQWKILIHNDIEKASLIGWKRVYLEKMRPKRYKTDPTHHPRLNILQRNRIGSVSTLNTPDSRASTIKTNFTMPKRVQEIIKNDTLRSTSEIFGKDFKVISTSTGKSTERTERAIKAKCSSRNCEVRPNTGGRVNLTSRSNMDKKYCQQPTHSFFSLVPLAENPKQNELARKSKSPRTAKCKVTSIRTRSSTAQAVQQTEILCGRLKSALSRPNTGKTAKTKQREEQELFLRIKQ